MPNVWLEILVVDWSKRSRNGIAIGSYVGTTYVPKPDLLGFGGNPVALNHSVERPAIDAHNLSGASAIAT